MRDTSALPVAPAPRPESGVGSEYGKEARDLARRRKLGFLPRQKKADDLPWIVTSKGNDKEKTRDKQ